MTIKEALLAEMDDLSVSERTLEKIIADHSLSISGDYVPAEHRKVIDMCLIDVYKKLLPKADVSEGGFSIRWNKEALKAAITVIYRKWGMTDPDTPKVRSISR